MDADVIVIGGGPVGASLGLLLRRLGLRALVLDRARFPRDKPCGEGLMPSGAAILGELGVDLAAEGFPAVRGVRYRMAGGGHAFAAFPRPGFGVRRLRLDAMLADRAEVVSGVAATALHASPSAVEVETSSGTLRARALVGADGLRSRVSGWMGWKRQPRPPLRHALVGHWEVPGHGLEEITVTLLGDAEVYVAPSGPSELLAAVLGPRGALRLEGCSVTDGYREMVTRAHPELGSRDLCGRVGGAGPFRTAPAAVAAGRVFLAGDAAGFLDPLTGEAMAAGLAQAHALARFLSEDMDTAAARYRDWHRTQWRRRYVVSRVALALTGSDRLARRALAGVGRRPVALERLLEVNDGSRGLATIRPWDWAALAGF